MTDPTPIQTYARPVVVAAGPGSSAGWLSVSVSLLPTSDPHGTIALNDIRDWTRVIHEWFSEDNNRKRLFVEPIAVSNLTQVDGQWPPRPALANGRYLAIAETQYVRKGGTIGAVNTYWQTLIKQASRAFAPGEDKTKGEVDIWTSLAKAGDRRPTPDATPFMRNMAATSGDQTLGPGPNLLPTGRTDAALAHALENAAVAAGWIRHKGPPKAKQALNNAFNDPQIKAKLQELQNNLDQVITKKAAREKGEELRKQISKYVHDKKYPAFVFNHLKVMLDLYEDRKTRGASAPGRPLVKPPTAWPIESILDPAKRDALLDHLEALHETELLQATQPSRSLPKGALKQDQYKAVADSRASRGDDVVNFLGGTLLTGVLNSPMLSRLFGFTVDMEFKLAAPESLSFFQPKPLDGMPDDAATTQAEKPCAFIYLALRATPDAHDFANATFTLAKVSRNPELANGDMVFDGFWPATAEEIYLRAGNQKSTAEVRASGVVTQLDGIIDLGQTLEIKTGSEKGRYPRFDIITADPALAVEARKREFNRAAAVQSNIDVSTAVETAQPGLTERGRNGLMTRGLQIGDRWRASAPLFELVTTQSAGNGPLVLDADDLTVGFRVDVAERPKNGLPVWRSLMEREINYHIPEEYRPGAPAKARTDSFKAFFRDLGLPYEEKPRRHMDSGMIRPMSKTRAMDAPLGGSSQMIHCEEILAAWEGDPLGLNCGTEMTDITAGTELPITRIYNLPREDDGGDEEYCSHALRFGSAYQFGLRPVWKGGVSMDKEAFTRRYISEVDGLRGMTLPASDRKDANWVPWRRFLRHEPILPPVAVVPEAVAVFKDIFARQSALRAILRTSRQARYKRRDRDTSWHMLLPPRMSLDDVIRHGSLDAVPLDAAKPPLTTMSIIDYGATMSPPQGKAKLGDKQSRAFPVIERIYGDNGMASAKEVIPTKFDVYGPAAGEPPNGPGASTEREEIFRTRGAKLPDWGDLHAYYHDPMAHTLVIAIRHKGSEVGEGYFPGKAHTETVAGSTYGVFRPIALKIQRAAVQGPREEVSQEDFFRNEGAAATNPATSSATDPKVGFAPQAGVKTITIYLRAGEEVEIDCWFTPTETQLRQTFDVPEAITIQATADAARAANLAPGVMLTAQAIVDSIDMALDKDISSRFVPPSGKTSPDWMGPGRISVNRAALAYAAQRIHHHLQQRPLPQVAGVRTISAIHAVDKPNLSPDFRDSNGSTTAMAAYRAPALTTDGNDQVQASGRIALLKQIVTGTASGDVAGLEKLRYGNQEDTAIVLSGMARIDPESTRLLEVDAYCTTAATGALDDVRRSRTDLQRLLGEWPASLPWDTGSESAGPRGVAIDPGKPRKHASTQQLFGFDVDGEGNVTLPRQRLSILKLDILDPNVFRKEPDGVLTQQPLTGYSTINLAAAQLAALNQSAGTQEGLRTLPQDFYSDTLARRLTLTLRATARHDAYFLQTRRTADTPVPEVVFPPDPAEAGAISRESANPARDVTDTALLQTIYIPATIAPARPAVHTVLPVIGLTNFKPPDIRIFRQAHAVAGLTRMPTVRIYLERPWYSSGEGERLGIVLWPPGLKTLSEHQNTKLNLTEGIVPRTVMFDKGAPDLPMELADFVDEDLGPGGRFTTRWGVDPIRGNESRVGPFLPWSAMADVREDIDAVIHNGKPGYVDRVTIPLEDPRQLGKGQGKAETSVLAAGERTLTAALATYEPKFDVEAEKWFVDVTLNVNRLVEPFIRFGLVRYQHHAAPSLRCSAPITVWAQVLPKRTAVAWIEKPAGKPGNRLTLHVQTSGPTAPRVDSLRRPADIPADKEWQPTLIYPRTRFSVSHVRMAGKHVNETTAKMVVSSQGAASPKYGPAVLWSDWRKVEAGQIIDDSDGWYQKFELEVDENWKGSGKQLAVDIEEIEDFLSTADVIKLILPPKEDKEAPADQQKKGKSKPETQTGTAGTIYLPHIPDAAVIPDDRAGEGRQRSGPRFLARLILTQ